MKLLTLASGAVLTACASTPEPTVAPVDAALDPFAACVAPSVVTVHREDGAAGVAIVDDVAAGAPADVLAFRAAAERCGPWQAGEALAPHLAAVLAFAECGAAACPDDWPKQLVTAMKKAPAADGDEAARCVRATPGDGLGWGAWTVARLLEDPALGLEAWVDRVVVLGGAQLVAVDGAIVDRLDREEPEPRLALARLALGRVKAASERLRFRAAQVLLEGGDTADASVWLNQLAKAGRTAWRAFAQAELDRLAKP